MQSGERLEDATEAAFRTLGVRVERADDHETLPEPRPSDRSVLLNAPYRSIYGHEARIEFLFYLAGKTYLIEAKRQTSPGSVYEKLAFVRLNALHNGDRHHFVLVMDGDGFREGGEAVGVAGSRGGRALRRAFPRWVPHLVATEASRGRRVVSAGNGRVPSAPGSTRLAPPRTPRGFRPMRATIPRAIRPATDQ